MKFGQVIPIIRFYDEERTKEFYIDFLGFQLDWEHRYEANMPLYLQVSQGDCVIHLSQHFRDGVPGSAVRIEVTDIVSFSGGLLEKRYTFARPGTPEPGGDLTITDPAGNQLRFYERFEQDESEGSTR